MSLAAGTKLGPFEVLALVGSGGMGEVYRARDTKLGREVAIKILPPEVTDDAGRLARFRREAHVLASLNHPHIAAIYGFEEADGQPFLVMELVEGEDLSQRLLRGAIPLDEALEIARQTAEALEAAHEKGIVHRDLKPGNIVVNEDGQIKVLDFGLAKAIAGEAAEGSSSDLSQSPTLSRHETATGVILGTAAYMSPEQARGKQVDKRADIWGFGVVLFEMLTGRPLFSGETVSDVLASVLRSQPDWARLPTETPPEVRRLLRRCLVRDPKARLRDIGDARLELVEKDEAPIARPRRAHPTLYGTFLLAGILVGLGIAAFRRPVSEPAPVRRATIQLERPLAIFTRSDRPSVALSPDGSRLAYRAWANDPLGPPLRLHGSEKADTLLYLRRIDELDAKPIGGTEGAYLPFFSPDGEWLGFFAGGKLMKVPVGGGVPTRARGRRRFVGSGLGVRWDHHLQRPVGRRPPPGPGLRWGCRGAHDSGRHEPGTGAQLSLSPARRRHVALQRMDEYVQPPRGDVVEDREAQDTRRRKRPEHLRGRELRRVRRVQFRSPGSAF